MNLNRLLPKVAAILFFIISVASCKEDFAGVGSNIIGDQTLYDSLIDNSTVIAFSKKLVPLQTSGLPVYKLGIYTDPVYGTSTINLLSQVIPQQTEPTFGDSAVVESVTIYLPYFSTATATTDTTTYVLDSIYGTDLMNITLYESNYFLRDLDPETGFQEPQKYYSNQGATFNNFLGEQIGFIENFKPSNEGFLIPDGEDTTRLAPGVRADLPVAFFQQKIIDKEGGSELLSLNNFKDYFRGINFQVSSNSGTGNLFYFDIARAEIDMKYSFTETTSQERDTASFKFRFTGVNVNTINNQVLPQNIQSAINNPDIVNGEEKLYLRGGEGIVTIVNLFGPDTDQNGVADELEVLRRKRWLINEANLIFYVDQSTVTGGSTEPERIVIFNTKTNQFLADYLLDPTNSLAPSLALNNHLGILQKDGSGNGTFYKLRITNHISDLINTAEENAPLGIIVSQNVLSTSFLDLQNTVSPGVTGIPGGSAVSHEGTVLFGNNTTDASKKLKLQIYYTEPN